MAAAHDIIVKVGLTADQFVWMHNAAEENGLSDSAFVRQLIQQARRSEAMKELSTINADLKMADQVRKRA